MTEITENMGGIGERLRKAREFLELKQEEAAAAVGIPRSALSLIENGRRKVDSEELARFARVYGQSVDALAGTSALPPLPENVHALARAATELSDNDRNELLRFAEFLQARGPRSDGSA
jgi:transcriptional regulator with XRE-family HTH domain